MFTDPLLYAQVSKDRAAEAQSLARTARFRRATRIAGARPSIRREATTRPTARPRTAA
jgi:hypothetical protein